MTHKVDRRRAGRSSVCRWSTTNPGRLVRLHCQRFGVRPVTADIVRKAAEYAAAGRERYWIIDPQGPVVIAHHRVNEVLVEQNRYGPGTAVMLAVGPTDITFDPAVAEGHAG